jgi:hypothetical protein
MHRVAKVVFLFLCFAFFNVEGKTSKADFDAAKKVADRDNSTPAGQRYTREFALKHFAPVMGQAMDSCLSQRDTVEPAMIILIVGANGNVIRVLSTPGIEYGECVASKLHQPISLPRPPHDNFALAFGVANHSHAEKKVPVDKPIHTEGEAAVAYNKAIAPYVAKARKTYPGAKKRFLAGLPRGWRFCVSYRLIQNAPEVKQYRFEDVIVDVDKIENGKVYGRIANKLGIVTNYRYDQSISFPESDVMNWLFVRPDGSEEGNILGNFLDHYKPQ